MANNKCLHNPVQALLLETGLLACVIVVIVAQLVPQIVASIYPVYIQYSNEKKRRRLLIQLSHSPLHRSGLNIYIAKEPQWADTARCWNTLFIYTRRYSLLRGLSSSSSGELFMLFLPILGCFWRSVVTSVTFSGNLSYFFLPPNLLFSCCCYCSDHLSTFW